MLTRYDNSDNSNITSVRKGGQRGVVLIIALVVLVAMTLAAAALVRSVDTTNLIAGNLAFQQAALHSADTGFETAISWLQTNRGSTALYTDDRTNGYIAHGADGNSNPAGTQSWHEFWNQTLANYAYPDGSAVPDQANNTVHYVIQRMCMDVNAQLTAQCSDSPVVISDPGNAKDNDTVELKAPSVLYYRITVRVDGPKNTVSYVQTVVSM